MIPVVRRTNWLPGVFNDFFDNEWVQRTSTSNPAVNIMENENDFKVEVAAPGLTKEDFQIEMLDDNHLTISMEKKNETKEEGKNGKYLRREFSYVSFTKNLILPDNVEKDKIEAKVENGVLTVVIPKQKEEDRESKPRKININ